MGAGAGALTAAAGPVLGGSLVDAVSSRAIFLLNLPIAAIAMVLAQRSCRRHARRAPRGWTGLALSWRHSALALPPLA